MSCGAFPTSPTIVGVCFDLQYELMPGRTTNVSASTQDREPLVVLPKKRLQIAARAVCLLSGMRVGGHFWLFGPGLRQRRRRA
jgi:hypothetical protein